MTYDLIFFLLFHYQYHYNLLIFQLHYKEHWKGQIHIKNKCHEHQIYFYFYKIVYLHLYSNIVLIDMKNCLSFYHLIYISCYRIILNYIIHLYWLFYHNSENLLLQKNTYLMKPLSALQYHLLKIHVLFLWNFQHLQNNISHN